MDCPASCSCRLLSDHALPYGRASASNPRGFRSRYCCLPNLAALIGRSNHRVADLALERLGEGGSVRERGVDAEAVERVRVGLNSQARGLRSNAPGPDLRPPQEETLLRREARDCRRARLAFERLLVSPVGDGQPAEVCDRLADDELALLVQPRLDLECVELLHHAVSPRVELLVVLISPPLRKVAVGVELRALIVEAVRHLVSDDRADAAVVERVVGLRVIEG